MHEIFKLIPHQRVVGKDKQEIFDLYQCGIFKNDMLQENIEIVELQANTEYRPHYHKNSSAVIYIIAGDGLLQLGDNKIAFKPEMRVEIPAGTLLRLAR